VVLNGTYKPDYFRSRMLAFAEVIKTGHRRPWNVRYASEVRGLCKVLAGQGTFSRRWAFEQFRYGGVSVKGILFFCAAMFGKGGLQVWDAVAEFYRTRVNSDAESAIRKNSYQTYIESMLDRN
jgi:hypothetical protein